MKNKIIDFLNLGNQPLANSYIKKKNLLKKERKYKLVVSFNKNNKLVSIKKTFSSKDMFNKEYPYRSSTSQTMSLHLNKLAQKIKKMQPKKIFFTAGSGRFDKNFKETNNNYEISVKKLYHKNTH